MNISAMWPVLRSTIVAAYSFNEIKTLAGDAGFAVHKLGHLQQRSGFRSSTKGQLMDGLDNLFSDLSEPDQDRVICNIVHDIWTQREHVRDQLSGLLERVGWGITDGEPHPLELQVDVEIAALPDEERKLVSKSLARYRQGDFDGAVTAICSVVDSLTERIYQQERLQNHRTDSYQQRVNRAFCSQKQVIVQSLTDGGFSYDESQKTWQNLQGAINQAAYVLGAFRREISDVHGASKASHHVVQRALDAAVFIVRSLFS